MLIKHSFISTISTPSFTELEAAARAVIGILKTIPKFSNSRITIIGGLGAPKVVKDRLLAILSSPLQSPYVLSTAVLISVARLDALPYISELNLLVFKINCYGLRPTPAKKLQDTTDTRILVEDLYSRGSINLTPT
ncbi:hypothetical protein N7445_006195 [Penicillium cf. griseofulvum]|nr:hypothetical protein N7445_006195 [Penicillium cf. griseofulvum]